MNARGPGASADDGKRTLHEMKRSFTFIFSIESTPSPAGGLGGPSTWQDFLILILAGLFKAFSDVAFRRLAFKVLPRCLM